MKTSLLSWIDHYECLVETVETVHYNNRYKYLMELQNLICDILATVAYFYKLCRANFKIQIFIAHHFDKTPLYSIQ